MNRPIFPALVLLVLSNALLAAERNGLPATDQRGAKVKTLDTRRTFPEISSRAQWETRAREIREHVLVSCGLWPMPEKTPLHAKVFDRVERDGYTIEKVHFQPLPGFYLAGNLYRPLGKGAGPFPAILNPHGHWRKGRLEDQALGSIAARCINFAKQGMVAFSYDMVGYNDTSQVPHTFANDPTNLLWNISLMGLQTWNSIRALDFLESLPDVDKKRLACTGESGGGTQTFMLGAIDPRMAVQAPIVMVSHSMQGGCLCENAPGLRLDYSNMEIAATSPNLRRVRPLTSNAVGAPSPNTSCKWLPDRGPNPPSACSDASAPVRRLASAFRPEYRRGRAAGRSASSKALRQGCRRPRRW